MKVYYKIFILLCFLVIIPAPIVRAQDTTHTESKKVRYLRKLEKKNERYVKVQEKKTRKLLASLSAKEKKLLHSADSLPMDSTIRKGSFSTIGDQFGKDYSAYSQKINAAQAPVLRLNTIPANMNAGVQNYLKRQVTTSAFLNDTTCKTCGKLKKEEAKAQQNLSKTSQKLEYIQGVQDQIKKRQETLQGYFGPMPQYASQLQGIGKSCFYFNQGMSGFSSIFTSPAAGVENSMMQSLSFNKSYATFAENLKTSQIPGLDASSFTSPDLKGYQTRVQVQALLPQNTPGITAEQKSTLISNMQTSLSKFQSLRDKNPSIACLKDKPNFKPNPYKSLPLRQRITFGKDFQMHPRSKYYPVTADIGINLGFKLTARFSPIVGAAYKLGLGPALQNMSLSDQGIVLRGGLDGKLCYGFSLQGLFEETIRTNLVQVNETLSKRVEPALILGLVNKVKIGKKTSSSFMFGYDFLYNKHTPVTSPWVIRIGFQ
jgi:hypothetical protein